MKRDKWQVPLKIVTTIFNMLLVVFTIILFMEKFVHGSIRFHHIDFNHMLLAVFLFGVILIPLQLLAKDT